jgi:hypothetical protein
MTDVDVDGGAVVQVVVVVGVIVVAAMAWTLWSSR